jgi:hypothetical protein
MAIPWALCPNARRRIGHVGKPVYISVHPACLDGDPTAPVSKHAQRVVDVDNVYKSGAPAGGTRANISRGPAARQSNGRCGKDRH